MEGEGGFGGDRDTYGDVDEERKPLIRRGCSAGRIMNACIAFDYLLILITSLIVAGTIALLNSTVYS